MTGTSTNLGLTYYDSGDTAQTFLDYRTGTSGSTGSNMSRIDAFAGSAIAGGCIPFTTGGTGAAYTATGIYLLDGTTTFPASVPVGTKILLKPNTSNTGACTLQINGGDINSLLKVYAQTDGVSNLQSGDLQTAKYYLFFFNGSAWVLLDGVSLNQLVVNDAINGDLNFSTTTNAYTVKTGAITLPKMADISSGKILGRVSSGSGVVEELTSAEVIAALDLANALIYLGSIDCSTNPNYPTANAGDLYVMSVAGKIGGASGEDVEVGDMIICNTDATPSGDEAAVGVYWDIIQGNIGDGSVALTKLVDATAQYSLIGRNSAGAGPWEEFTVDSNAFSLLQNGAEGVDILSTGETGGTLFLGEDGDGTSSWKAAGGGAKSRTVILQGTTSYTIPAGTKYILVQALGGGGGGGGAQASTGSNPSGGGGGGGGGYSESFITSLPGSPVTVQVGAGGAGGTAGLNNGTDGTNTTFNTTTVVANGGGGGLAGNTIVPPNFHANYGSGGGAGTGDVASGGSPGEFAFSLAALSVQSGRGGNGIGPHGGGGGLGKTSTAAGAAGGVYGSGGGGGCSRNAEGATAGGAGANGIMVIWEFA